MALAINSEKMDKWIFLKFWNLLNLIESWRKKLVSQMGFFVPSLTSFKEWVWEGRKTEREATMLVGGTVWEVMAMTREAMATM